MVREQGGETRGLEKGEGSFLAPVALGACERIGVVCRGGDLGRITVGSDDFETDGREITGLEDRAFLLVAILRLAV